MPRRNVRLDSRGIREVARSSEMQAVITDLAEDVAEEVRKTFVRVEGRPGDVALPVEVTSYLTDRARSSVYLAHPAGLAVQAKHGVLTKAASEAGLLLRGER